MGVKKSFRMKIAVIDYNLGNVQSVVGAIEKLGFEAVVSNDEAILRTADGLILPGVGAFGDGMKYLEKYGLIGILNKLVLEEKKPILGICLGMQLFATVGHEFGLHKGLGWIDGEVKKFELKEGYKLPHMGWNDILIQKESLLMNRINEKLFYFVHSYCFDVKDKNNIIATCRYDKEFVSVVNKENIYGVQFHPEKSQKEGLSLIENFIKECCNA